MCHEEQTEKKRSEKIEEENTMRKFLSVLLAMAMVLSLTVTGFAIEDTATTREPEVMTEEATMAGKTVILHTNDVHGAIEGYAYITGRL